MNTPRLLPWLGPDGQPSYLAADCGNSPLWQLADEIEALKLRMGAELLGHAHHLLGDRKADAGQLCFMAARLTEALCDVLRIADSRGRRLPVAADGHPSATGGEPGRATGRTNGPALPADAHSGEAAG